MLNELEARSRTGLFSEGHQVKLMDGCEWIFPRPVLRFRPVHDKGGNLGMSGGWGHDLEYRRLRDALIDCSKENTFELMNLQLQIAAHLLLRNYDLSDDQLGELIYFDFEDPANIAMWEGLADVIFANPPKPSADGSAVA